MSKKFKYDASIQRTTKSRAQLMSYIAEQTKYIETKLENFIEEVDKRYDKMAKDRDEFSLENLKFKKKLKEETNQFISVTT